MGIADRDYIRQPQRRGRGGSIGGGGGGRSSVIGRPGGFSVTTWLIIINVAVFVIDAMLVSSVGPVGISVGREARHPDLREATREGIVVKDVRQPYGSKKPGIWYHPIVPSDSGPVVIDGQIVNDVGKELLRLRKPLDGYGHFSTGKAFKDYEVWRLVTFQFLHADVMHLAMNMMGLFFLGGIVESFLGKKKFLAFYLICGIAGGLLYLLLNFLGTEVFKGTRIPGVLINDSFTPLIGASAGVFGVIVGAARIEPNIMLAFPPVSLRVAAWVYVGFAMLNLLNGSSNAGGEAAHIGGAIAGFYFIKRSYLLREFFDVFGNSGRPKSDGPRRRAGSKRADREMDRILDKVNAKGLQSLSDREKRVLNEARRDLKGRER